MNSRTRSRSPASMGSNQSSRRSTADAASDCRGDDVVLLLVMAQSPPACANAGLFGFQHPETMPSSIPTTPRTAPDPLLPGTNYSRTNDQVNVGFRGEVCPLG